VLAITTMPVLLLQVEAPTWVPGLQYAPARDAPHAPGILTQYGQLPVLVLSPQLYLVEQ